MTLSEGAISGGATTGAWSIVSQPAGPPVGDGVLSSTAQTNNPAAVTFTATIPGKYILRLTTNDPAGSCVADSDEMEVTVNNGATADVGTNPLDLCPGDVLPLSGATIGGAAATGAWSIVSQPTAPTPGDGALSSTAQTAFPRNVTFTATVVGTYVLRLTTNDPAGSCTAATDDLTINVGAGPTADAGPDDSACSGIAYTLSNASVSGGSTGAWSIVSQPATGDGVLSSTAQTANPETVTFTATVTGTYTLRLTTSDPAGSCSAGTDDITITIDAKPTTANAGPDQTNVCGPAQLAGNVPTVGIGLWTVVNGPADGLFKPNATRPDAKFTGTAGVTYTLRWSVTNGGCAPSTDDVDITFDLNSPTAADAGPDRRACFPNPAFMLANDPNTAAGEIGTWTITPATGTVADANDPFTQVDGVGGEVYTLIWTIINPASPAGCSLNADTATVRFDTTPPLADAGSYPDPFCGSGTLNAKDPGTDDGLWTIEPGPVGIVIDVPTSYKSTFSGPAGTYNLRWTVTNACGNSTITTTVTIEDGPSPADAGQDQTLCGTSTKLAGSQPTQGVGTWSQVPTNPAGGVIANPALFNSDFSGTAGSTYALVWSIAKTGCTPNTDTVFIKFTAPVQANADAGADQDVCGDETDLNAAALAADEAGVWTIISANAATGTVAIPTNPKSHFDGDAGQIYVLRWEITKGVGGCSTGDADTVQITFNVEPSVPEAGPDQLNVCGAATLNADAPAVGTGAWSYVALAPATATGAFADPAIKNTTFSGQPGASYRLYWTITKGTCALKKDSLTVSFDSNSPDVANAGPDQRVCGIQAVTLNATPVAANNTGTWTAIIPNDGSIIDPPLTNAASVFHPVAATTYRLVWTVTNNLAPPGCGANRDTVVIRIDNAAPTVVDAGPDQTVCFTTTNQVTLAGSDPGTNDGLWTVASGAGGTFANDTLRNTTFTGTSGTTYKLYWTISNGCGNVKDSVNIIFEAPPTTPAAGPDQVNLCGPATMAANQATARHRSMVLCSAFTGNGNRIVQ